VVTAVSANSFRFPDGRLPSVEHEFAAGFAVTTARYARKLGLDVISKLSEPLQYACRPEAEDEQERTMQQKLRMMLDRLEGASSSPVESRAPTDTPPVLSEDTEFPINVPVWVESPAAPVDSMRKEKTREALLVVVPAEQRCVAELVAELPRFRSRFLIAVVGPRAQQVVSSGAFGNVIAFDPGDQSSAEKALAISEDFQADHVLAVQTVSSWDASKALADIANDNSLCEALFLIAQRNIQRLNAGDLQIWGLFLDGWSHVVHPRSGAISGMLKSIAREFPRARTATICTRRMNLVEALERWQNERLLTGREPEIVFDNDKRLVRRLRRSVPSDRPVPPVSLDSESVVVATGGAHGVTAVLLEALLRDYQCQVIAIGRSELSVGPTGQDPAQIEADFFDRFVHDRPQATAAEMKGSFERARAGWEAHQTITHLSSLGGRAEYMVADLTDREQLAAVMRRIADTYGRIDLVIHGAGVQFSKRLERRSLAEFRRTFAVKVTGLHNLADLAYQQFGTPVAVHALTSAYSFFGNDGQHDYGAANETLDRLCGLHEMRGDIRWSSIAWLAWDGVGMTRGSEYRALGRQRGLSGLTNEDGQRIFREVLAGRTLSAIHLPLAKAEHLRYGVKTIPAASPGTGRVVEVGLDLSSIPCLPYHKVRGTPTLPGAWILDCLVRGASHLLPDAEAVQAVTIENICFQRFVRSTNGVEPNLRVIAEETPDGFHAWLVGDLLHPSGEHLSNDEVFAQARMRFDSDQARLGAQPADAGNGYERDIQLVDDPYCRSGADDVRLSGPFDCLQDIAIDLSERRARFVADTSDWVSRIPALLLDAAWRVGAMYAEPETDRLYVPVRVGRVVTRINYPGSTTDCRIRSTAPTVNGDHVHWERTEVVDVSSNRVLIVEDISAAGFR
jgi:NAD(P)-dependent dehydrogenase (short-subunit alcohol dehydrogenase family)